MASHVLHDYRGAALDPQTRARLDFATKLTRTPSSMEKTDVQRLRSLGLTDEQILSVTLITCLYNFMTRLADGLGVELPPSRQEGIERWLTGPARERDWLMRPGD